MVFFIHWFTQFRKKRRAKDVRLEQSFAALDLKTILLLFSMMVINAHLYLAGFFGVVAQRVVQVAHGPRTLLALAWEKRVERDAVPEDPGHGLEAPVDALRGRGLRCHRRRDRRR